METEIKYKKIKGCDIAVPAPFGIVIFGASGDLTKRKLLPSLFKLQKNGLLPEEFFILGIGRTQMSHDEFRASMKTSDDSSWPQFNEKMYYLSLDYADEASYILLRNNLSDLEKKHNTGHNRIFYLAVPPSQFEPIICNLGDSELSREVDGYTHIVIEKPFGRDLESARRLNRILRQSFDERQIFRIDHFIAKETVQNIIMFRFANSIFEPLWNNRYVDHVQITASETIGIEHRSGYYEEAGVIRDMFPNHLFQLLAIIAMEPPPLFDAEMVRDEKVKLFRSIKPLAPDNLHEYIAAGQYNSGIMDGESIPAYREERGVSNRSLTPTFAAMKIYINNWRWRGVPFYIRSGKRMAKRNTEISIHFKQVPHLMFSGQIEAPIEPNVLVFKVQPEEGMSLTLQAKLPGSKVCLSPVSMDFSYPKDIHLDAYEWVLHDCVKGDQMLFVREDGVEATWSLLTPVIEALETATDVEAYPNYAPGSLGPDDADRIIEMDGRRWRPL